MQTAALNLLTPAHFSCIPASGSNKISRAAKLTGSTSSFRFFPIRATGAEHTKLLQQTIAPQCHSVFPAEACETIGGDACLANIYPEVKLKREDRRNTPNQITRSESVERDYLDYTAYQKTQD